MRFRRTRNVTEEAPRPGVPAARVDLPVPPPSLDSKQTVAPQFYRDLLAWLTSLAVHVTVLCLLGLASVAISPPVDTILSYLPLEEVDEPEPLPLDFVASDFDYENMGEISPEGSEVARTAATIVDDEPLLLFDPQEVTDFGLQPTVELATPTLRAPDLTDDLPTLGTAVEGTSGAVGAIDHLTKVILASLEEKPTLVVWLFDRSGSLQEERNRIGLRFQKIYRELGMIEAADNPAFRRHQDKPLLAAVAGFAREVTPILDKPTDRVEDIRKAIEQIENDDSGQEYVFTAVAAVAEKYRSYRLARNGGRRVMIVVFTDEAGNDIDQLESTVDLCSRLEMPVYVVGRPAPFGRPAALVRWIDPDPAYDQRPQWIPVHMGPESLLPERLHLAAGYREPLLDSGFGPFGLTRLCSETQGTFFAAHTNPPRGRARTNDLSVRFTRSFNQETMRRYEPEYVPAAQYASLLERNRARKALVTAAELSWSLPDDISWSAPLWGSRRRFVAADGNSFSWSLDAAAQDAARCLPTLDAVCEALLSGARARAELRKPRWEAGFDLALGRALAARVRADGYTQMLARAKAGMTFETEGNNTWVLQPDDALADPSAEKLAEAALQHLRRVAADHPDTPWGFLAQRELRVPMGWRWAESYTEVPDTEEETSEPPSPPKRPPRRNPPAL